VLAFSQTSKLKDHPLSAVWDCLFKLIGAAKYMMEVSLSLGFEICQSADTVPILIQKFVAVFARNTE